MDIRKIAYKNRFPSGLQALMDKDLINRPIQRNRSTRRTQGVDIDYHLGWDMDTLEEHKDTLLLAIYQEAMRYNAKFPNCGFWGNVYFKIQGKPKLPEPIGIHTSMDPHVFVYGPDYKVQHYHVEKALDQLADEKYEVTARLLGVMIRIYQRIS